MRAGVAWFGSNRYKPRNVTKRSLVGRARGVVADVSLYIWLIFGFGFIQVRTATGFSDFSTSGHSACQSFAQPNFTQKQSSRVSAVPSCHRPRGPPRTVDSRLMHLSRGSVVMPGLLRYTRTSQSYIHTMLASPMRPFLELPRPDIATMQPLSTWALACRQHVHWHVDVPVLILYDQAPLNHSDARSCWRRADPSWHRSHWRPPPARAALASSAGGGAPASPPTGSAAVHA